eukprot:4427368-Pyramimonas_sp.AAC.1
MARRMTAPNTSWHNNIVNYSAARHGMEHRIALHSIASPAAVYRKTAWRCIANRGTDNVHMYNRVAQHNAAVFRIACKVMRGTSKPHAN